MAGLAHAAETWKTEQAWTSPAKVATGLAWDGRYLWHGETWGTERGSPAYFYKTDPKTGRTLSTISSQIGDPGDIEWLNGALWVTEENQIPPGSGNQYVVKVDPQDGSILQKIRIDLPSDTKNRGQCEAVTSDGKLLYISYNGRSIIKVDPASGKTVQILDIPWANPNYNNSSAGDQYYLDGLCWAFGHIFAVTNTPLAIIEIDPISGAKLAEFKAPAGQGFGPEGLATDGSSIYYSENTYNRYYRITLIDGYFR